MNKEIKEILEEPKILMLSYGNYISLDDYFKLKDYITNLQEENEHLKTQVNTYKNVIDKAIEYINKHYLNANEPELLNILQGENNE